MKQLISKVNVTASANAAYLSELSNEQKKKRGMMIVQVILFSSMMIGV
jgi:hypothetical protein